MPEYEYISGGAELLDRIQPLWGELRTHHAAVSVYFGPQLAEVPFAKRSQNLRRKAARGALRVELAFHAATGEPVAYLTASLDEEQKGEIDSIYIAEAHRGRGLADRLMKMPWPGSMRPGPWSAKYK